MNGHALASNMEALETLVMLLGCALALLCLSERAGMPFASTPALAGAPCRS